MQMAAKYWLFKRNETYYVEDTTTRKQWSLKTKNKAKAEQIIATMNAPAQNAAMNLTLAKVYLRNSDPAVASRTWQTVLDEIIAARQGNTKIRWETASKDQAYDSIRNKPLIETQAEHLLECMRKGKVSTNVFLRKMHNFAIDMNWLPASILPKRQWPKVVYRPKRGLTLEEHEKIVARERNAEWKALYQLLWEVGGSQGDVVNLKAENVNWETGVLSYLRQKNGSPANIILGKAALKLLADLPGEGPLFQQLRKLSSKHRSTEFARHCAIVGLKGITLHSYRYALAERMRAAGYPERYAMEVLGHNSDAVHRAYAKGARVATLSLEEWQNQQAKPQESAAA
jgi:integrase